ncbi:hypothetical protein Q5752_006599 [Cryptotrichosporon argae]
MSETPPLRVYPATPVPRTALPLSIADSACADFAPCGAVWLFPIPAASRKSGLADGLVNSLRHTLVAFPQFTGTLRYPTQSDNGPAHAKRHARVWVSYGEPPSDPGAEVHLSSSNETLAALVSRARVDPTALAALYAPNTLVGLPHKAGPPLVVRITTMVEGLALGVKMHHSLADAQTLCAFMADWGAVHCALAVGRAQRVPPRRLDPALLDAHAAAPSGEMDDALNAVALGLPQIRLDFWAKPDSPRPPFWHAPEGPDEHTDALDAARGRKRGAPVPWAEWEWSAPVKDRVFTVSPAQVERIYQAAAGPGGDEAARTSRLDVLLGHIWRLIVAARQVPDGDVYLDMSVGLRARVAPALAPDFLGSPIVNASARLPVVELVPPMAAWTASAAQAVRQTVAAFTPTTVPALLHRMAHALDPAREWNCFPGKRHVMVTSWIGAGAGAVDFGHGCAHVEADMPACDGLVILLDVEAVGGDHKAARWYANGARVRVILQDDVMDRLVAVWDLGG